MKKMNALKLWKNLYGFFENHSSWLFAESCKKLISKIWDKDFKQWEEDNHHSLIECIEILPFVPQANSRRFHLLNNIEIMFSTEKWLLIDQLKIYKEIFRLIEFHNIHLTKTEHDHLTYGWHWKSKSFYRKNFNNLEIIGNHYDYFEDEAKKYIWKALQKEVVLTE